MNYNKKKANKINEAFFSLRCRNFRKDFCSLLFLWKKICLRLPCIGGNLFWIILKGENSKDF